MNHASQLFVLGESMRITAHNLRAVGDVLHRHTRLVQLGQQRLLADEHAELLGLRDMVADLETAISGIKGTVARTLAAGTPPA